MPEHKLLADPTHLNRKRSISRQEKIWHLIHLQKLRGKERLSLVRSIAIPRHPILFSDRLPKTECTLRRVTNRRERINSLIGTAVHHFQYHGHLADRVCIVRCDRMQTKCEFRPGTSE